MSAIVLFDYCRLESGGNEYMVAIIGDSHAHTLFPGLSDALKQKSVDSILLANSGCLPHVGSSTGKTK